MVKKLIVHAGCYVEMYFMGTILYVMDSKLCAVKKYSVLFIELARKTMSDSERVTGLVTSDGVVEMK